MQRRGGFTLVELLTVIAIIAILVALTIPAVQSARSAARRVQCANNQKQTGLGILQAVDSKERLPAVENPRLQYDGARRSKINISWRYAILPFMEQQPLHDALSVGKWDVENIESELDTDDDSDSRARHLFRGDANKAADISALHCPAEPGAPRIINARLSQGDRILFDGIGVEANFAPHTIPQSAEIEVGSEDHTVSFLGESETIEVLTNVSTTTIESGQPAAWYGRSRWHKSYENGLTTQPRLKYMTDGMSKTVLVHEETISTRLSSRLRGGWLAESNIDAVSAFHNPPRSHHKDGSHTTMADGAVRFIASAIERRILLAMIGRQDGTSFDLATRP